MGATRRQGTETSETRFLLLDITEQVMIEEGYAAVSSRSIAKKAGVTPALVHYYFPTLDDLFIAAFRRRSESNLTHLEESLANDDPLRVLWEYASDPTGVALTIEFLALANHRKAIQAEVAEVAERFRKVQLETFTAVMAASGVDLDEYPADALLLIMMAIPTVVVLEQTLGMSSGHQHALMLVERHLADLQDARKRKTRAAKPKATAKVLKGSAKGRRRS
jgi:AcrR family transcriptional regulator